MAKRNVRDHRCLFIEAMHAMRDWLDAQTSHHQLDGDGDLGLSLGNLRYADLIVTSH